MLCSPTVSRWVPRGKAHDDVGGPYRQSGYKGDHIRLASLASSSIDIATSFGTCALFKPRQESLRNNNNIVKMKSSAIVAFLSLCLAQTAFAACRTRTNECVSTKPPMSDMFADGPNFTVSSIRLRCHRQAWRFPLRLYRDPEPCPVLPGRLPWWSHLRQRMSLLLCRQFIHDSNTIHSASAAICNRP